MGGLVFAQLSVIPEDGSCPVVDADGLHIQVEQLSERRVEWALVSKLAAPAGYGQRLRKRRSGRRMRPIRRPLRCSGTKALDIHIRGLCSGKLSS